MSNGTLPIRLPIRGEKLTAEYLSAIVRRLNSLSPLEGKGVHVKTTPHGTVYSSTATGMAVVQAAEKSPFAFRYVEQDAESGIPYTGYEIYLPDGCVSVGMTCRPLNPPALRVNDGGQTEDVPNWYRLPFVPASEDNGTTYYVTIHAKPSCSQDGVDEFDSWPRHCVWAEINTIESKTDEESVGNVGDAFAVDTGRLETTEDAEGNIERSCVHTVKFPVNLVFNDGAQFLLNPVLQVDSTTLQLTFTRLFIRNQSFSAAGSTFEAHGLKEIDTDCETVHLVIDSSTSPYTASIKTYKSDEGANDSSNDDKLTVDEKAKADKPEFGVSVMLYRLDGYGHVKTDNRTSLYNIQLYQ